MRRLWSTTKKTQCLTSKLLRNKKMRLWRKMRKAWRRISITWYFILVVYTISFTAFFTQSGRIIPIAKKLRPEFLEKPELRKKCQKFKMPES